MYKEKINKIYSILPKILSNIAEWVVVLLTTIIMFFLCLVILKYKFNAENSVPEESIFLYNLIVSISVIGIFWFLGNYLNKYKKICSWLSVILFIMAILFIGIISFQYVTQVKILPESDPKACLILALNFFNSDFSAVVPKDSYLTLWPFQTGFIFILEKTMRLFQNTDPLLFQKINCLYLMMIVACGYGIVCSITKRIEGRIAYLLLSISYVSIFFDIIEVYGDIPGFAWVIFSNMCFIFYYKSNKKLWRIIYLLLSSGGVILACTYKRNCLIYAIAFLLVVCVLQLKRKNYSLLIMITAIMIVSALSTGITQKYYEYYAGNVCGKGVPSIAFIAMGLQYKENGEEFNTGGWNGFHSDTFMQTGYDYEKTVEISLDSIHKSLQTFKDDPEFMVKFFYHKTLIQWANQTHGVFWGLNNLYDQSRDNNSYWVKYLDTREYNELLDFMDIHESILYAIMVSSCILLAWRKVCKEDIPFEYMIPFVTFIGGFMFSMIWEAQTGAVVYYPMIVLPTSIGLLFEYLKKEK